METLTYGNTSWNTSEEPHITPTPPVPTRDLTYEEDRQLLR
jgi:hypothetical protein